MQNIKKISRKAHSWKRWEKRANTTDEMSKYTFSHNNILCLFVHASIWLWEKHESGGGGKYGGDVDISMRTFFSLPRKKKNNDEYLKAWINITNPLRSFSRVKVCFIQVGEGVEKRDKGIIYLLSPLLFPNIARIWKILPKIIILKNLRLTFHFTVQ